MNIWLVGAGGFLGAVARLGVGRAVSAAGFSGFPWATLIVNLLGCFMIGALTGVTANRLNQEPIVLFFGVGFLGAFTTFSALGLDSLGLLESKQLFTLATNICVHVGLGIFAVWAGRQLVS